MQIEQLRHDFFNAITFMSTKRHKLIILLANDDMLNQLMNFTNIKSINLNLLLSQKLLDVPNNKRSRITGSIVNEIVKANDTEILVITGYELFFLPELKQDPIRLFEELSRKRIIVVLWKGKYENGTLKHAEPWHREYREYSNIDAEIIQT